MDEFTAIEIALTNLLAKGVDLHNEAAGKIDALIEAKKNKTAIPTLNEIGSQLTELVETYKNVRELAIVADYLAGNDIFIIMNDFKITRPTIMKILHSRHIEIRK